MSWRFDVFPGGVVSMSAICGAISFGAKLITENERDIFRKGFSDCAIDRWEEKSSDKVYMACGVQYFTPEAKDEILPIVEKGKFFTADVMLDNREELFRIMDKEPSEQKCPDGTLLYEIWNAKGRKCLNDVLGAFSGVYYDEEKKEAEIFADAVGNRFVYYLWQDKVLYFSSLMKPLEKFVKNLKINENFASDFVGNPSPAMFMEENETMVEGIYRLPIATVMRVTETGPKKTRYWDPYRDSEMLNYKSYKEYKKAFLKLYRECVTSVMRSPEETGIMLSGGYDSTSVAVMASPELKKRGKELYSYTWIPLRSTKFDESLMAERVVDEEENVRKTAEFLGNLKCHFMDMPDMDIWNERHKLEKVFEGPYKSLENGAWFYRCYEAARKDNVRVLLTGELGNRSISFENTREYFATLFRQFKFRKLKQEVDKLHFHYWYTRKSIYKTVLMDIWNSKFGKTLLPDVERTFVNKKKVIKNGTLKRVHEELMETRKFAADAQYLLERSFNPVYMRLAGEISQKMSIYAGVIDRDPTKDKRIIAFCAKLTPDQFTHNGYKRALITDYMKEIFPEHILKELRKGIQSGDFMDRVKLGGKKTIEEMRECCLENLDNEFVDARRILEALKSDDPEDYDFLTINYAMAGCVFMESTKVYKNNLTE